MDINPIPYKAFIEKDNSIQELIDLLETLQKKYSDVLRTISQDASSLRTSTQANTVATEEGRQAINQASEATSRLSKLQAELKVALSSTGVEIARVKAQLAETNKENTLFVKMTESQKTTIQNMKNELAVLIDTYEKLTTEQRLSAEQSGALVQRILQLKTALAEAASAIKITTSSKLEQRKVSSDLDKALAKLTKAYSDETIELLKIKRETDEVIKIRKLEAIANDNAKDSYNRLAAQYELNKITLNKYSQAQIDQSKYLSNLQKDAAQMRVEMIRLQEATGNHALSVGNYTKAWNGLGVATQQVVRELPSLAVSAQTFFLAISNNVPILADEIKNLVAQNKAAAAIGKQTTSVWTQLGKSLLSWQTGLVLGLTLLSLYGGKFVSWIADLIKGDNALKAVTETHDKFLKSLSEGNNEYSQAVAELSRLTLVIKNVDGTYLTTKNALDEYNESLGKALGPAEDLVTAHQNIIDKGPKYLEVMFQMAMANAFLEEMSNKAAAAAALRADKEVKWYQKVVESFKAAAAGEETATFWDSAEKWDQFVLNRREKAAKKLTDQGVELGKAYAESIQEGYKMAAEAGIDLFEDDDDKSKTKTKKEPKGPSEYSIENENIKIRKQYLESLRNLERDEIEKRRKQLVDAHNIEIANLRNKQKNEAKLTQESRDLIDKIMANSYKKLLIDIELLGIEEQQRQLNVEKETLDLRLSLMAQGTAEYYKTRAALLRNQMQYEILENKKQIETLQRDENAIRAKYNKDIIREEVALDDLLFKQQQAFLESEFDLIQRSEYSKTKFRLEQERDRQQRVLEMAKGGLLEMSELEIATVENTLKTIDRLLKENERNRDVFDLLGLDLDSSSKSAIKESVAFVKDQISDLIASEIELAEIKVSKAQDAVAKAEEFLRYEMEARNQGYANYVETARMELAAAKEKEEKALKQREQAQLAQNRLDTLAQVSSLVTASANIWSTFSKMGPWGIPAAIAAIAVMFGSFIAAKSRAKAVIAEQNEAYEHGHVELLEGGSHASGNDIPLGTTKKGKQRRAEGGEILAVVSKKSVKRYGSNRIFDVVESINKGVFEEKYTNIFNPSLVQTHTSNNILDLYGLDGDVRAIRKSTEFKYYKDSDGLLIEKYKNRTRTFLRR